MWSIIQNRTSRTRSAGSIVIALASGLFITGVAAPAFADHSDRHTARQDRVAAGEVSRRTDRTDARRTDRTDAHRTDRTDSRRVDRNDGRRADRQMSRRTDEERRQWRQQKRHEQQNWVANNHQRRADRRHDRREDRVERRQDRRDARRDRRHDRASNRWWGQNERGYANGHRRTPERGYIRRGVERGNFTRREAQRLRQGQRRINRLEQHFLADGRLSRRESRRLNRAQQEQWDLVRLLRRNNR